MPITQTEEQRRRAFQDAGVPIGSADLTPIPSVDTTPAPQPKNFQPAIDSSLENLLASFNQTTPEEIAVTDLGKRTESILSRLGQESARKSELETAAGLPTQNKELQSVINQLQTLSKEQAAIPLQIQEESVGRGVTKAGIAPIEASRTRQNTIKALGLAAIGQTLQGNISLANATIQSALDAEFEPLRNELEVAKLNYQNNKDMLERIDKKKADNLNIILNERTRLLGIQEADKKEIYDIGKTAGQFGADSATVQKIMSAGSREEAATLAGAFLQDPMAKQQLENAKLDNILTKTQINKANYELSLLEKYGGMTPAQYADSLKEERKAIAAEKDEQEKSRQQGIALGEKVNVISAALNSPALETAVGPSFLARGGVFGVGGLPDKLSGARQNFVASVENLVSREFLDNLISVKAQGATFGALTEKEQQALTSAATKIGTWRIENGAGKVVGYNASEADFRAELKRIQDLTRTAYQRATGSAFTEEEQALFDEIDATRNSFSPAF